MKRILLLLLLIGYVDANQSCFTENTSIETSEIGKQIVDVMGCNLVASKNEWGNHIYGLYLLLMAFLFIVLIPILIYLTRSGKNGK